FFKIGLPSCSQYASSFAVSPGAAKPFECLQHWASIGVQRVSRSRYARDAHQIGQRVHPASCPVGCHTAQGGHFADSVAPQLDEFNRHAQLESAITESELSYLKSKKRIDTLLDYRKERDTIQHESNVVKFLDKYKTDIDELFAWLDPEVRDFKLRRSQDSDDAGDTYAQHLCKHMPPLTHLHPYYDEDKRQKTAMLGNDYSTIADDLLKNSFPDNGQKEYNPIQCLIAPPRHGKSLVLAQ
ncbi:Hypothetical protein, putative, partial [Bodo saltans]